jgi:sec-independent protein translocase protein TatA
MLSSLAFFQNMGVTELIIILVIVLLLFGSTKLPSLARSLGSSVNEFKKGMKPEKEDAPKAEEKPAVTEEKK